MKKISYENFQNFNEAIETTTDTKILKKYLLTANLCQNNKESVQHVLSHFLLINLLKH
jgi:hypothetical protein